MLNCSPQAVRRPNMCVVAYTHDCDPFEIRLWAPFPLLFGSRKFPPHCCVRLQWFVPLVFVAFLCVCGFIQPAFSVSLKRRQRSSRGPIWLSSPGHTRFRFHGAPHEGCRPGQTPGTHWDPSAHGTISVITEVTPSAACIQNSQRLI